MFHLSDGLPRLDCHCLPLVRLHPLQDRDVMAVREQEVLQVAVLGQASAGVERLLARSRRGVVVTGKKYSYYIPIFILNTLARTVIGFG